MLSPLYELSQGETWWAINYAVTDEMTGTHADEEKTQDERTNSHVSDEIGRRGWT